MSALSEALALRLQLEEIEEFQASSKGKEVEGDILDRNFALIIQAEEMEKALLLRSDRNMTISISRAVETDADVISAIRAEEDDTHSDRRLACSLGGAGRPPKLDREDFACIDPSDEVLQQFALLNVCKDSYGHSEKHIETSTASSSKVSPFAIRNRPRKLQCIACREEVHFFDVLTVPCNHGYCRDCIVELFEASTSDESLFPPKCCQRQIPVDATFIPRDLISKFHAKSIEFSDPNRTYCYRETCSTYITPLHISGDKGTCPACHHQTCTLCKRDTHIGDCPNDPALQSLMALAAENGWIRCYSCHRMVELNTGCNHITSAASPISSTLFATS
ncbi:hypothetical protein MMC30_003364 [Trapelia coarctata]|nr:hypothetical protein [Trapelia coarctata]